MNQELFPAIASSPDTLMQTLEQSTQWPSKKWVALGLDLSLRATGICDSYEDDHLPWVYKPKTTGTKRLAEIRNVIEGILAAFKPDLVLLEGYSFGSQGRSIFDIAELGGVIRLLLHDTQTPWAEVAPPCLKKFATGRGNANKSLMVQAAAARSITSTTGAITFPDDNAADAWWLTQMALHHLKDPRAVQLPALNRAALDAVQWPLVGQEEQEAV